MKTVFMFPGQGSQVLGMGKDFYDKYAVSRDTFEMASDTTHIDVKSLCFEENDKLDKTEYTQLAILTVELAIYEALKSEGLNCDITAGLSLGEYASLVVSGVLKKEDVFPLIRKRGVYMQNAVPTGGAMTAIINLDSKDIELICYELSSEHKGEMDDNGLPYIVSIANYNSPSQIVISGTQRAVENASEKCLERGALQAVKLNVSGPFHSCLLKDAEKALEKDLGEIAFNDIQIPYIANVSADIVNDKIDIAPLLTRQVTHSVKWQQTIEKLIGMGVDNFIEVGPGRTLSGFLRKTNKKYKAKNVNKVEDIIGLLE